MTLRDRDSGVGLSFRVLGDLAAARDGTPLDLGGRHQRAVIARLVLARGSAVPVDEVIDAAWGDRPPATAEGTLHSYVSNLRRQLEPGRLRSQHAVLVREGPGYALRLPTDAVDAWRFDHPLRPDDPGGGPAGIGKSRLLAEARRLATARGAVS